MMKLLRNYKAIKNAVDDIWKNIIRPEKPKNIGDALRYNNYISYLKLIEFLSQKFNHNKSTFKLDLSKNCCCNLSLKDINNFQILLPKVFRNIESIEDRNKLQYDYVFLWGAKLFKISETLEFALKVKDGEILFIEDGFFRSVCGGLKKCSVEYSQSISLTLDRLCPHYDGNHVSQLEVLLSDNNLDYIDNNDAQDLKSFILEHNLSKYNDQPNYISPRLGFHKNKVLVIMQTSNDASVTLTGGSQVDFEIMIENAISENPDADIILKVHPDTIIKQQKGYAERYIHDKRIVLIDFEFSIPSLLNYCSKVYVYSSQVGFEALLRNKEVIVYGKPFYAGYGLTNDVHEINRTVSRVSLDKMFYDVMYRYTSWFSKQGNLIEPRTAINDLNTLVNQYNSVVYKKVLVMKLDGLGDWIIFEKYLKQLTSSKKFKKSKFYLIGDVGFKDFVIEDNFFNKSYWINFRRSFSLLKLLPCKNFCLNLLIKKFLLLHPSLKKINFDAVIFSCWNNEVNKWGNKIVQHLSYKDGFCRNVFANNYLHLENLKLYNKVIPITGDHLRYHRSEIECAFLENICERQLSKKIIIENKPIEKIFIFCGAFARKRRWDAKLYIKLAKEILKTFQVNVYIYGIDPSLKSITLDEPGIIYSFGRVDMHDIVECIKSCDLYIGGDTGFYHLAYHKFKPCVVVSNGNSLRTFCQVPRIKEIDYVFPDIVDVYLSDRVKWKKQIFDITLSSSIDINDIPYKKVWKVVYEKLVLNHKKFNIQTKS